MRTLLVTPALITLGALLSGCSSSGAAAAGDTPSSVESVVTSPTVCAAHAKAVDLPAGFPSDFPFPKGTVVTSADDRGAAGVVITGIVGAAFPATLRSLNAAMKSGGFTIGDSESEPHDAEADWSTPTYEGRWSLREAAGCDGETAIQVVASPKG